MSKTFDQGKDEVAKLCQYFATNHQSFLAPGVKEAHVRQSLIDPFFEALGWDVRNASMAAPQYREVIPEDSLDVEGQQKAPDYTFRVGTLPKFYVEAKKCGINISADPATGLSTSPLRLQRQTCPVHPDRLRGTGRIRLRLSPAPQRQGQPCPYPVFRLHRVS